jgi:hypothetical protein
VRKNVVGSTRAKTGARNGGKADSDAAEAVTGSPRMDPTLERRWEASIIRAAPERAGDGEG